MSQNPSEKELVQQKLQAQIDAWQAEIDKLRAQATELSVDARLAMGKRIDALQNRIEEATIKLEAAADVGEDTWASVKDRVEAAWDAAKSERGKSGTKTGE